MGKHGRVDRNRNRKPDLSKCHHRRFWPHFHFRKLHHFEGLCLKRGCEHQIKRPIHSFGEVLFLLRKHESRAACGEEKRRHPNAFQCRDWKLHLLWPVHSNPAGASGEPRLCGLQLPIGRYECRQRLLTVIPPKSVIPPYSEVSGVPGKDYEIAELNGGYRKVLETDARIRHVLGE